MGRSKGIRYTPEYKRQAVQLAQRMGLERAATELGVCKTSLNRWKQKRESKNLSSEGETQEQKIRRLEKENEDLKKANFILRKAAAFFSQDQLK